MRADLTASLGYRFIWRSWQFNLTLKPRLHDTAGCQTGCTTALTTGCIV